MPIKENQCHTPVQDTAATGSPDTLNRFPVQEVLHQGQENAINAQYLADILGFDSVRELQREIARERAAGAVILSTCENGGGYYLPADSGEVRQFIRTLENRAANTYKALQSARTYLKQQGESEDGKCKGHH